MARRGFGKRKIAIKRVEEKKTRAVTFSKRKEGLFTKASELATLCGTEVALLIYSPGGKVFSFGHPSADAVLDRFLDEEPQAPEPGHVTTQAIVQAHRSFKQSQQNFHLTQMNDLVRAAKMKGKAIDQLRRQTEGKVWWERPTEEFRDVRQLELLLLQYKQFHEGLYEEMRLLQEEKSSNGGVPLPSIEMGGVPLPSIGSSGGPVLDQGKGKAPAVGPRPSGSIPHDPTIGGSSYQAPAVNPSWPQGFNFWVPYAPMLAGSSSQAPIDPMTIGGTAPLNPMDPLLDPLIHGFDTWTPYAPSLAGYSCLAPMNPTTAGQFDGMAMDVTPEAFNPNGFGSQGGGSVDPNAPGPSTGGGDNWRYN